MDYFNCVNIYAVTDYDLELSLKSGQFFRYTPLDDGSFVVQTSYHICIARQENNTLYISTENQTEQKYWRNFFAIDDSTQFIEELFYSEDYLRPIYEHSKGLRIFRQDPWECLVSFICSQQKTIPQIRKAVFGIAKLCGEEIIDGYYDFPAAEEIIPGSLKELSLGYREKYVYYVASVSTQKQFDIYSLTSDKVTYSEAMNALTDLYGVGEKVANCVALFSLGFGNAFPIDTHIKKFLDMYPTFNYKKFGDYAGLVQQYIFRYMILK